MNITTQNRPILLVDDEETLLQSSRTILRLAKIGPVIAINDSRQLLPQLEKSGASLLVLDLTMPYLSGTDLMPLLQQNFPELPIMIMTAAQSVEVAVQCMKMGAFDYLTKPIEATQFVIRVRKALEVQDLRQEVSRLRDKLLSEHLEKKSVFKGIITQNPSMFRIFQYLEAVASSGEPLLVTGETGVGKESIIQALHQLSCPQQPLVGENVAGLDDALFSDTLFGHTRGAFTGAQDERKGLVAKAGQGILFLDEIGDLSPSSQIKLLRLIQEKRYLPVGSDTSRNLMARIVATTHRNLEQEMEQGRFRPDLFFRLSGHQIHLPPLRDRPEDLPLLTTYFLAEAAATLNKKVPPPKTELYHWLADYPFPGNIRELRAMVFDAAAQYRKSGPLSLEPFRAALLKNRHRTPQPPPQHPTITPSTKNLPTTLKEAVKTLEEQMIAEAMEQAGGSQSRAAARLGISRQALNQRLRPKKTGKTSV